MTTSQERTEDGGTAHLNRRREAASKLEMKHACSALALLASLALTCERVGAAPPADETFFRTFIESNCTKCHNAEKKKGKLNLEDLGDIGTDRVKYATILEQLRAGDMPPEDEPQPPLADSHRVTAWIQQGLGDQPLISRRILGRIAPIRPRRVATDPAAICPADGSWGQRLRRFVLDRRGEHGRPDPQRG